MGSGRTGQSTGKPDAPRAVAARPPRRRNPQGTGSQLREELTAAAGRLLAASGEPESLSLRAVAREAGVAAPSVYLQFDSKEDLLRAVVIEHFAIFQRAIETAIASVDDAPARLLAGCLAYCHFAEAQPGSYRIIFDTQLPPMPEITTGELPGMSAFAVLVNAVAACMESGAARPGDPFIVARDNWTALHGIVQLRRHLPDFPWSALDDQVAGVVRAFTGIERFALPEQRPESELA